MNQYEERWERFLDPTVVAPSLFIATMFVTTFEILKDAIISRVRDFYLIGFSANEDQISKEYSKNVLSRNKSKVYASLDWLIEQNAIDQSDLETFEKLKTTRNLLAHELFQVVTGQVESNHQEQFNTLIDLLRKIEVWSIVNFEMEINSDYADQEINQEEIVPGRILSLQMLMHVATGGKDLLDAWRSEKTQRKTQQENNHRK